MALYFSARLFVPSPGGEPASTEAPCVIVNYQSNSQSGNFIIPWSASDAEIGTVITANLGYYPTSTYIRTALRQAVYYVNQLNVPAGTWPYHRLRMDAVLDHPTSGL